MTQTHCSLFRFFCVCLAETYCLYDLHLNKKKCLIQACGFDVDISVPWNSMHVHVSSASPITETMIRVRPHRESDVSILILESDSKNQDWQLHLCVHTDQKKTSDLSRIKKKIRLELLHFSNLHSLNTHSLLHTHFRSLFVVGGN